jgi:tRNA(Ile)-lysidine synthase
MDHPVFLIQNLTTNLKYTVSKFTLSNLLDTFRTYPSSPRLWIAYSGGLDSSVLLHAIAQLRGHLPKSPLIGAIHIHHGLQLQADNWAIHCQQVCEDQAIPCEVIRVKAQASPRESPEACARTARYAAIAQLLAPEEMVLTAQHADDQVETVLLQLLRGAGVAGLAAMPHLSRLGVGWLARPLLAYTRADLYEYVQQAGLPWIEDSSNANTHFARNFLRHEIIPRLRQRWPSMSQTFNRVAHHQAEAKELVEILAAQDLQACQGSHPDQLWLPTFSRFRPVQQRNLLRFWLKQLGLPLPATVHIQQILNDMLTAKEDRNPLVSWRGGEVRRYRQHLFAMPNLPVVPQSQFSWPLPQPLPLPLGWLQAREIHGRGLALPAGTELQVQFRQSGEKLQWRGHQREVKKLLQAAQLPPWLREFMPLIYFQNSLVAIPGIGVCDKLTARAEECGWEISWNRNLALESSILVEGKFL